MDSGPRPTPAMPVAAAAAAEATDGALIGKAFAKPLGALKAKF